MIPILGIDDPGDHGHDIGTWSFWQQLFYDLVVVVVVLAYSALEQFVDNPFKAILSGLAIAALALRVMNGAMEFRRRRRELREWDAQHGRKSK